MGYMKNRGDMKGKVTAEDFGLPEYEKEEEDNPYIRLLYYDMPMAPFYATSTNYFYINSNQIWYTTI